jgi:hypothetical protein
MREPHFAWSRWKATPWELVAVKSWTGMTARPREMSRFFSARGMVCVSRRGDDLVVPITAPETAIRAGRNAKRRVLFTC